MKYESGIALRPGQTEIGRMLVEQGVITPDAAMEIIAYQRLHNIPFGRAAVLLNHAREEDVRFALALQFNYPYLRQNVNGTAVSPEVVTAYQPFGELADKFRDIRSKLVLAWSGNPQLNRMIAITSDSCGEGRSYIAANLAVTFAQMGQSTLLVDGDLRAPRQHNLFNIASAFGLSTILSGRANLRQCVVQLGELQKLHLLPAGPTPPNPLELLSQYGCSDLFAAAKEKFSVTIVDTSADVAGDDALMLGVHVGATVIVALANKTRADRIAKLTAKLQRTGVQVVGSVLNAPIA